MSRMLMTTHFAQSDLPPHNSEMEWRKRLTLAREEKRWTQTMLQERTGIHQSTISKWETGKDNATPDIEQYACLAAALGLTLSELYGDAEGEPVGRPDPEERALLAAFHGSGLKLEDVVAMMVDPIRRGMASGAGHAVLENQPRSDDATGDMRDLPARRR